MAERPRPKALIYAVVAAVAIIAAIVFVALNPVRRARPTINNTPPEASAPLTGGPANGVGDNLAGNTSGDR